MLAQAVHSTSHYLVSLCSQG